MTSRDPVFTTRTDREDGFDLRAVAFGDEVVLARLYFAARDPLWRTVPLRAVRSQRTTTPDGFVDVVEAVSESPAMPMAVTLEYRAAGDELVARAVAVAGGDFNEEFAQVMDRVAGPAGAVVDGKAPDMVVTKGPKKLASANLGRQGSDTHDFKIFDFEI